MAVFSKTEREFIIRRLAAFDTHRDVCTAFKAVFPCTACTENDVIAIDPRNAALPDPDLLALFQTERGKVIGDPDAAPYADQAARLIVLSKDVDRYRQNNDIANARAVLRQIAEEIALTAKSNANDAGLPPVGAVEVVRKIVDPAAQ